MQFYQLNDLTKMRIHYHGVMNVGHQEPGVTSSVRWVWRVDIGKVVMDPKDQEKTKFSIHIGL